MAPHRVAARPSIAGCQAGSSSSGGRRGDPTTPRRRARGAPQYPYASDDGDGWTTTPANTWTSGFFPGVLWNLHNLTGKAEWRAAAERWTERIANQQRDWSLQHDYGGCPRAGGGACGAWRQPPGGFRSRRSARSALAVGSA